MKEFIIISDLHCGSRFAVTNNPKNNVQKAIKKIWQEMLTDLETHRLTAGINLGDSTDGTDYHGQGKSNDTSDKFEQINIAYNLMQQIPTDTWFCVSGSGYHVGSNLCDDQILADKLGAKYGSELVLDIDSSRIHCSHKVGISMSATAYRPTAIAREMMLATINQDEYGKFKAILRGHAHYYCRVQFGGSQGLICPCWKGRDIFAQERSLALMPHLGYVIMKVGNGKVDFEPHIFTLKGKDLLAEVKI